MKKLFRFIIGQVLAIKAKQYLKKNHTQVIAITGSIGKTSTKEAIYTVLKDRFNVYRSEKSFNTPIGLSLAVLQEKESGFSSIKAWFGILRRTFFGEKTVYKKMILEMGADTPGDIKKLIKIAPSAISVVTNIAPVHLAEGQFKDIYEIAEEKGSLIKNLSPDKLAILNYDDPLITAMETRAQKFTYGTGPNALLKATEVHATSKHLIFNVTYGVQKERFTIPVLGKFQIYVFLPAIAVGLKMGMSLQECAEALSKFSLPPGRMNPIDGKNKSIIIDGSYNASPATMEKALELLMELKSDRKIAALGTMNELGDISKEAHLKLGKQAFKVVDMLITIGPEANTIKEGAMNAGMSEDDIFTFLDSEEAGHFLLDKLEPKDLVLVKGSQNRVRMEKFVKVVMAKPEEAPELLCRQGEAWQSI
ncbi:UDP-N-acetylmuramoyl-tripeptide--D-alanyl-D-alanine ligase [Patescibacteria group bacterium]|nr:UDP-N-acetylmuramoyl-tripeptide--D-alanyl-D-alanine ligase [Patescibacteria group bacterium]MBU1682811.1 UDP-N-acetylmuramoyl-tripeptide--D-alanyl-D-alanine ligase [Patescibacteria group bacterium]MBU1935323.1 UDP-N-acetylmuramoyl-tripeptide--D-alanyl-D-alanine ligase [Patescibacteria group bacterium]